MIVAQASGYSSNSIPRLGTSICCRCSPKKDYIYIYIYATTKEVQACLKNIQVQFQTTTIN